MCHMSHVTCHMSRVMCQMSRAHVKCHFFCSFFLRFFLQNVGAHRWRVCYKRGLPRLVFFKTSKQKIHKSKKYIFGCSWMHERDYWCRMCYVWFVMEGIRPGSHQSKGMVRQFSTICDTCGSLNVSSVLCFGDLQRSSVIFGKFLQSSEIFSDLHKSSETFSGLWQCSVNFGDHKWFLEIFSDLQQSSDIFSDLQQSLGIFGNLW